MTEAEVPMMPSPDKALEMYRPLIEGSDQAMPILLYCPSDGQVAMAGLVGVGDEISLSDMIITACMEMRERFESPLWVVVSWEGYGVDDVSPEEAGRYMGGQLNQRAAEGDTRVRDVACVTGVSTTDSFTSTTAFTRTPEGVAWDETKILPSAAGDVMDTLMRLVR